MRSASLAPCVAMGAGELMSLGGVRRLRVRTCGGYSCGAWAGRDVLVTCLHPAFTVHHVCCYCNSAVPAPSPVWYILRARGVQRQLIGSRDDGARYLAFTYWSCSPSATWLLYVQLWALTSHVPAPWALLLDFSSFGWRSIPCRPAAPSGGRGVPCHGSLVGLSRSQ